MIIKRIVLASLLSQLAGLTAAAAQPTSEPAVKLSGRIQPFYSGTFNEGEGEADKHAFEIRRSRVTLEGKIHGDVGWKLQVDYGKGFLTLKDAHFDWKLADDVFVRVGQWKRPFSRQRINSSGRLELTTRGITDGVFGAERDIGFAIRNDYEKSPDLEWVVGVFNGHGTITSASSAAIPARFKPAFIARVGLNRGGIKGYQEADLEGGPLRWGVGASVWIEADRDKDDASNQKAEVDFIMKAHGFSATGGIYGQSSQDGPRTFSDQGLSHVGFHLQPGYMLDEHWQVAARYALVDVQTDFESATSIDTQELGLGGTYFVHGHDAKFQAAVRIVKPEGAELTDSVVAEVGANVGF